MAKRKFRNVQRKNKEAIKKKRIQTGITIVFILLMIFSIMGIYVSNLQNTALNEFKYGDYEFEVVEETPGQFFLSTTIDDKEVLFYSLPQDTLVISTTGNVTQQLVNANYVALAHNLSPELIPLIDLMRFDFDRYAQTLSIDAPLYSTQTPQGITCLNATPEVPVITLVESTTTEIIAQDNCVQILSTPVDLYIIRDRILYSLLGIMQR